MREPSYSHIRTALVVASGSLLPAAGHAIAGDPVFGGCFQRFHVPGRGYRTFIPGRMLDTAELFLANGTQGAWAFMVPLVIFFTSIMYSDVTMKVMQECPPLMPIAYLLLHLDSAALDFSSYRWLNRPETKQVMFQALLVRALYLMHSSRRHFERRIKSLSPDTQNAMFAARWPSLDRLPIVFAARAGCTATAAIGLSLRKLIAGEQPTPRELGCPAGNAIFSPREFFARYSERGVSPTRLDLFWAMAPSFSLRPAAFDNNEHHHILAATLEKHLEDKSALEGLILEFGSGCRALSARLIAQHLQLVGRRSNTPGQIPRLRSFDSFQGLPRTWRSMKQGTFAVSDPVCSEHMALDAEQEASPDISRQPTFAGILGPPVESNVEWVVGYFNESVRPFLQGVSAGAHLTGQKAPSIALAHVDPDLYESTLTVLEEMLPYLTEGSILVLDDIMFDIPDVAETGLKENWDAFFEFLQMEDMIWRIEVLEAPWHLDIVGGSNIEARSGGGPALAIRLVH